jgi:uncharacterized protein (DUF58 family)
VYKLQKTKEILKKVRKLEIKTKKAVESLMQGAYHSIFRGRGIEFSDVREYVPGDDIRSIDWNITARMNEPYIKEYIEERNLTMYIMFDISASNDFGSTKQKKESAIELAASIIFSAVRNNDKIGLCLFTNDIEQLIMPKTGKKHALKLIREMIYFEPKERITDLKASLIKLGKIIKKRSIIFVMSDFLTDDFDKQMRILNKKHDVIAINYKDIREEDIPDIGYIELEDSETGEQFLVDTSDPGFRANYKNLVDKQKSAIEKQFKKLKIDMIQLKSGEDFMIPIKKFFAMRIKRAIK